MQPHFEVTGKDGEASMKLFLPHRWVKKGRHAMMSDIPIPSDMLFLLSRMFFLSLSLWKIPVHPSKSRSKVQVRKQFILFSDKTFPDNSLPGSPTGTRHLPLELCYLST